MTVPAVAGWAPDDLTVWAAPVASSFGALLFVLAAWVPDRQLRPSGPLLVVGASGVTAALLLTMVLVPAFAHSFPPQVVASLAPGSSARPDMSCIWRCPACNSRGRCFTVRPPSGSCGVRGGAVTQFLGWLAVAAMLAAASQVNYLLSAMNPQSLYGGDALRCSFLRRPARWFDAGNLVLLACAVTSSGAGGAAADRLRAA